MGAGTSFERVAERKRTWIRSLSRIWQGGGIIGINDWEREKRAGNIDQYRTGGRYPAGGKERRDRRLCQLPHGGKKGPGARQFGGALYGGSAGDGYRPAVPGRARSAKGHSAGGKAGRGALRARWAWKSSAARGSCEPRTIVTRRYLAGFEHPAGGEPGASHAHARGLFPAYQGLAHLGVPGGRRRRPGFFERGNPGIYNAETWRIEAASVATARSSRYNSTTTSMMPDPQIPAAK